MKILWVVNHCMEDLSKYLEINKTLSGNWLSTELSQLKKKNIEISVICPYKEDNLDGIVIDGVSYYTLKATKLDLFYNPSKKFQNKCNMLVNEIKPDIIHVHGTEFAFQQAFCNKSDIPVLFSIQGLVSEIDKYNNYFGKMRLPNIIFMINPRNVMKFLPIHLKKFRNYLMAKSEKKILQQAQYIIGRTVWDEAHTFNSNPNRKYYFLQEKIRKEFFEYTWNIENIEPLTIFCASGYKMPLKGLHRILEACSYLKKEFPTLRLKIVGTDLFKFSPKYDYSSVILELIYKYNLENNVEFLGDLNAKEMAQNFSNSHVYVMGSTIENSANTLGEAMVIGTPSIVPFVGGLHSLATDEVEVLFYNSEDIIELTWQIRRIFMNNDLAIKIGNNAYTRGKEQYKNNNQGMQLIDIYNEVLDFKGE